MLRYGISAFCCFCFLSFGWSACAQENRAPLPLSKKDILQGQSATAESASLKELSQKLETIERDMGNIQSESGLKAKEVQRLEAEVQTLNQDIIDIDEQQDETIKLMEDNREELSSIIVSLYKMKSLPSESMFLNPDSAESTAISITTLKAMAPQLSARLEKLQAQMNELKVLKRQKSNLKAERANHLKDLSKARRILENTLARRNSEYQKTSNNYQQAKEESERAAAAASNLKELVQNLAAKNRELSAESIADRDEKPEPENRALQNLAAKTNYDRSKAKEAPSGLLLPAQGLITVGYGETDHIGAKSQGVYIAARQNAIIVTPSSGTVKYAGEFKNHGQMVIVEHEKNYYSLIAGLTKIDTVVGQNLSVGEPLGQSGQGGDNNESFVYYELRKNGRPVDPIKNLKNL